MSLFRFRTHSQPTGPKALWILGIFLTLLATVLLTLLAVPALAQNQPSGDEATGARGGAGSSNGGRAG